MRFAFLGCLGTDELRVYNLRVSNRPPRVRSSAEQGAEQCGAGVRSCFLTGGV